MEPLAGGDQRDIGAWLDVVTQAMEMLLRHAERQLDVEIATAFTAGERSLVLLRQIERDRARDFREQLRERLRPVRAVDVGV